MIVSMLVRVVGPMLMIMLMGHAGWRQISGFVGVIALDVARVIVTRPAIGCLEIGAEQALAMMPARTKDVVVLLALRGSFFFIQAEPFAMRMFDQQLLYGRRGQSPIASSFEEKAKMDIHQAIEAKT